MFCNEIGCHDLQIRLFLENWQIVQCNLQIGQIGRLDGTNIIILNDTASQREISSKIR